MASYYDSKSTAIETQTVMGNGQRHISSDGLEGVDNGSGSMEMNDEGLRGATGEDGVDAVALEQAIDSLEAKNAKWYAYLTTRDFWIVLAIG